MTVREALNSAIAEEMRAEPNVFVIGEEVAQYDGAYKVCAHPWGGQAVVTLARVRGATSCYACLRSR